jgi:hypothetical protein
MYRHSYRYCWTTFVTVMASAAFSSLLGEGQGGLRTVGYIAESEGSGDMEEELY